MKLFFIIPLILITSTVSALELSENNYTDIINKHIYFVPQQKDAMLVSEKKLFNKHKGKEYLVKNAEVTDDDWLTLTLIDQSKKKPKETEIKIKKSSHRFEIKGGELIENLETAKSFFKGKTLYVNPLIKDANFTPLGLAKIRLYKEKNGIETFAQRNKGYPIIAVEWNDTGLYPYKLVLPDGQYAATAKPNKTPYGFVFDTKTGTPDEYHIYKKEDKLEKQTFAQTKNVLETKPSNKIDFNFSVLKKNNQKATSIEIIYSAENWLFANEAVLYIDGEKIPLKKQGKIDRSVYFGGLISESIYTELDTKLIQKIINGKEVFVRIYGDKGYVDGKFIPQNIYNLKRFYEEEIKS